MGWAGRFVDRLVRFADKNPDYGIMVTSSKGQCAADGKRVNTQLYIHGPFLLLNQAGIEFVHWVQ
jgi:hypothetical protein